MTEGQLYEEILLRMLESVPSDVDKREGSVIYDALAPAAAELSIMYWHIEAVIREAFATTANRDYLVKRAAEFGLYPDQASCAVMRGEFNINVPLGSRFSCEGLIYSTLEKIGEGVFKMQCEMTGVQGNKKIGRLVPLNYIDGLTSAQLTELIIPGTDEEDTEHFRQQLLLKVQKPITSGNANHYKQWALEVNGVGAARVMPLWNGPGTVKILIVDTDMQPASQELIDQTVAYIEQVRPIGATVTIVPPAPKTINVSVTVILAGGVYLESVKQSFRDALQQYLMQIAFDKNVVSLALIGSMLLDISGVTDYSDLTLNGSVANVRIEGDEVPELGIVEVTV